MTVIPQERANFAFTTRSRIVELFGVNPRSTWSSIQEMLEELAPVALDALTSEELALVAELAKGDHVIWDGRDRRDTSRPG